MRPRHPESLERRVLVDDQVLRFDSVIVILARLRLIAEVTLNGEGSQAFRACRGGCNVVSMIYPLRTRTHLALDKTHHACPCATHNPLASSTLLWSSHEY